MSHHEKQSIFDQYAQSKLYHNWEMLVKNNNNSVVGTKDLMNHIFAACDLVQEEQQRRIAEKEETISGDDCYFSGVPVEKIINPENLIK